MSSTIIIYLFLLFSTLSLLFFNCANGHLDCEIFPSWNRPPACRCFYYNTCPFECDINDCIKPFLFDCNDYPSARLPRECRCDNYDQYHCPSTCDMRDCRGYVPMPWYWYVVIVGVIIGIIVLIIVCICIRASISSKRHGKNQPQTVASQPQVVATVNI